MYSSTLYVSLAAAFVFFLKSLNVFRNTLVNRSTSSRVVPIAAAAVKYVVGYAECDAPKPRNSIPPTVCVSPGAMISSRADECFVHALCVMRLVGGGGF